MGEWQSIGGEPKDGSEFLGYGSYFYPGDKSPTEYYVIASYNAEWAAKGWPWETHEGIHRPEYLSHWAQLEPPK